MRWTSLGVTLLVMSSEYEAMTYIDYDFLESESVVLLEQLRTIDKQRLSDYLGQISLRDMQRIESAMSVSLGMKEKEAEARHE